MMREMLFAAVLSMMWPGAASAATGEWLLRRCLNEYGEYGQSVCTGYIYASIDASTKDCRPAGVTYSIVMRVVVAYLRNHPEKLHMNAAMLGADAMAKAYPCPAKPNGKDAGQ